MVRTFYEFFAGGGMARLGLGTSWNCVFANDIHPLKARAYVANHGNGELRIGDISDISPMQLPGRADLAWASFPCQDLSLAGNGAGLSGNRSGTFLPFWMLMLKMQAERRAPRICVLENVCGLLTSNAGRDFAELCRMLQLGGYKFGALVMDASQFLPQSRPRLFIVAVDRGMAEAREIAVGQPHSTWHTTRLRLAYQSLADQLKDDWLWFAPALPSPRETHLIDIIEESVSAWHGEDQTRRLLAMMSPLNRMKVEAKRENVVRSVGTVYRRTRPDGAGRQQRAEVRFDGLAGCLRTPGGGSSRQTVLVVENGRIRSRLLTARETARLMGLPDQYRLPDRYNDAYHVTGDGVAVPVVRWLAEQVLEPLLDGSARLPMALAA